MFGELILKDVVDGFHYDEEKGEFINDDLGLSLVKDNALRSFTYNGRTQYARYGNGRQFILVGKETLDTFVLLSGLFMPKNRTPYQEWLMRQQMQDLETYNFNNNVRMDYDPRRVTLQHIGVDAVDVDGIVQNTTFPGHVREDGSKVFVNLNKLEASRIFHINMSTIWDMIHPDCAMKIGYQGVFLRSHSEEPLEVNVDYSNESVWDAANETGCYLLTNPNACVTVCQGPKEVANFINEVNNATSEDNIKHLTFEGVNNWLCGNTRNQPLNGYFIRRVDDVHGKSIRFTDVRGV